MNGGMNLASKYAAKIDERFARASQAMLALNNDYKFTGVKTVNVYSIPVVPMTDYTRSGTSRYGEPDDLSRTVQTLTINRDRAYTFIIDRGDRAQSQMVMDAGKALSRQLAEVVVPEYDTYVFRMLAAKATERGNYATTPITKENAYESFLAGMERLGNKNVPDSGRVCFCTYKFANLLKQDSAFMRYGDTSQEMLSKGVIGEVDGCKIVKVPASRLPAGAAFLLTYPSAATAPKQLEEYKIHAAPPGISGWLVEGRFIYACFVLKEKADAIYYHGAQAVMQPLNVLTAASAPGETSILVEPSAPESGNSYVYTLAADAKSLPAPAYGESYSGGTALSANGMTVAAGSNTVVGVIELDGSGKAVAYGSAEINVG